MRPSLWFSCLLALTALAADETKPHIPLAQQPLRMAKDITAFEAADKANPPPQHALLFSGASTLRMWKNVGEEMKPYPVINRGFGGSFTTEVLGYMDRITLPYHPRVVVFQCGGNDINSGDPVEAPIARIREYLARLRKENPACAVVFVATTRAPSRKPKWDLLDDFNRQLEKLCREEKNLYFVDINLALNLPNGEGKPRHYLKDNLHPDVDGYKAIAGVLKPAVDAAWKATEAAYAGK
ncbi:MAG: GDSL-type esterase/lipase family protein [Verrucomicrobiota bacterium]